MRQSKADNTSGRGRRRFLELDGLRGIAALWVVIFHYTSGVAIRRTDVPAAMVHTITPWTTNIQGLRAVDLFFIISGYVIFMTLEKCRTIEEFAVSRIARLYPAFWAAVFITASVIIAFPIPQQTVTIGQIAANFTMLQSYIGLDHVEAVYWSLTYELGFYLMIAGVFACGLLGRIEQVGFLWLAASFLCFRLFPDIGDSIPYRVQALTCLPYAGLFFAGILFYRMRTYGVSATRSALLLLCYVDRIWTVNLVNALIFTGIFGIFALCVLGHGKILASKPLVFLGTISYPLYLLHRSIGMRVQMAIAGLGVGPYLNLALAIAVALVVATSVTFLVERPGNRRLRALLSTKKDTPTLEAAPL